MLISISIYLKFILSYLLYNNKKYSVIIKRYIAYNYGYKFLI